MTRVETDVAIIGSGFAGSITALALASRGRRVVLVERGRHPRFAIGESSTPLTNLLLEELSDRYGLEMLRPLSKWGTWQRERPDIAVGLKRGFAFYFHDLDRPFRDDPEHERQMLVAASPRDAISDTHWYRADFDMALARAAEASGVTHLEETRLSFFREEADGALLEGASPTGSVSIAARFVIDASGPRGFLSQALNLSAPTQWLPATEGLYSHFTDVDRWDTLRPGTGEPFPPDDAALHHVFPGGWIWVLRFNNGITSAGAALMAGFAAQIGAAGGAPAWARLLERLPSVGDQFRKARAVLPFMHAPRVAFRTRQLHGPSWALLPSAAGVIDPLLSTGFPLTLLGVSRLVEILESTGPGPARENALREYARVTQEELDVTEQLVAALYATMNDPSLFKRLTLLYFAAVSYAEAARRLARAALAPGFLLNAHPEFGPELRACATLGARAPQGDARRSLMSRIDRAIEPFDTAGLLDGRRRDWYPVLPGDLLAGAAKLQASSSEIHTLLQRTGFV